MGINCSFIGFMLHIFPWFWCWTNFQTYCCWGFLYQLFYNFRGLSNKLIFNYVVHVCFFAVWVGSYLKNLHVIHIIFNYLSIREVGCYNKNLLYFILSKVKLRLPLTIFNFIKSKIMASREEMSFFILYGRVLSELFSQEGIVKKVQKSGLTEALVTHWGLKLDVTESNNGQRQKSKSIAYGVGPSAP